MEGAKGNGDMFKETCLSDLSCKETILVSRMRGDDMHSPCCSTADLRLSLYTIGEVILPVKTLSSSVQEQRVTER